MLILREICERISLNPIPTQTIDFSLVNISQKTTSFARTRSGTKNSLKQKRGPFNSSPFSNNPFAKTNASTATPIDRSSPFFSCQLAKYHSGSVYFKCSSRFQNFFSLHACSVSCTSGIRSKLNNQKRNCITTKKGGNTTSPFQPRRFLPQIVSCSEKRRRQRPVLDLSALNQFIETEHFKMENLVTLKSLLNKEDYMINLDLTDAYLTVPMHPDSRKFLRFLLGDKTYEFTAMPFGLNVAPRLFTKIMKPVVASLRSQGVRLIIYLDDILIIASSIETLNRHKTLAVSLLESLGFLINYEKSNLTPSQQIVFLGMLVDSASMQFILPQQKAVQIQKECRLLNTNRPTIRHLSRA